MRPLHQSIRSDNVKANPSSPHIRSLRVAPEFEDTDVDIKRFSHIGPISGDFPHFLEFNII